MENSDAGIRKSGQIENLSVEDDWVQITERLLKFKNIFRSEFPKMEKAIAKNEFQKLNSSVESMRQAAFYLGFLEVVALCEQLAIANQDGADKDEQVLRLRRLRRATPKAQRTLTRYMNLKLRNQNGARVSKKNQIAG